MQQASFRDNLEDLCLGFKRPIVDEIAAEATRKLTDFISNRLALDDGKQRDEDLIQPWLDRTVNERFARLVLPSVRSRYRRSLSRRSGLLPQSSPAS